MCEGYAEWLLCSSGSACNKCVPLPTRNVKHKTLHLEDTTSENIFPVAQRRHMHDIKQLPLAVKFMELLYEKRIASRSNSQMK
jgi:hypothetical protein